MILGWNLSLGVPQFHPSFYLSKTIVTITTRKITSLGSICNSYKNHCFRFLVLGCDRSFDPPPTLSHPMEPWCTILSKHAFYIQFSCDIKTTAAFRGTLAMTSQRTGLTSSKQDCWRATEGCGEVTEARRWKCGLAREPGINPRSEVDPRLFACPPTVYCTCGSRLREIETSRPATPPK